MRSYSDARKHVSSGAVGRVIVSHIEGCRNSAAAFLTVNSAY
jgi:hypothetical protein